MSAATLSAALPPPRYAPTVEDADDDERAQASTSALAPVTRIPPYGQRSGWKPRNQEDFADGGAYPECHIAQYPLEMGRKKQGTSGGSLALQVDGEGNVRYDAIVQQGRREGQHVQSQHKDLVPLTQRAGAKASDMLPDRPDAEAVAETAQRTRAALEKIVNVKIKGAQTSHVEKKGGDSSFVRYTPGQQGGSGQQRIIKMTEQVEDPLEPPRWKFKKVPKGPPSPPPPVLRSPPRKITAQEQKDWVVPPSISNWKNNKGYTIPLDKRLAADGRGLQDVHINDGFAQFSEALVLAERHAREEVRQRSAMQQKLAAKEKASREEHLRLLAQRAREERAGIAPSATPSMRGGDEEGEGDEDGRLASVGGPIRYGSAGPSARRSVSRSDDGDSASGSDSEDDEDARQRDRLRAERRRERERELRMSNMGTEQRAKMLMREQNRDISEKVALGLAKPTAKGGEVDSRLFNQEKLNASFGDEESYNLYDRSLLNGSSAAQAIYSRPTQGGSDEAYGGGTAEGVQDELNRSDRFGLGKSKAFSGAEGQGAEPRSGPVLFEKDTSANGSAQRTINDPFQIDAFLSEAQRGAASGSGSKREGLQEGGSRKRQKGDDD
ncbi:hypothetical protein BDZ90DRAFT_278606 [Jaminaea rosea]|uniref:Pre-mRNA-processing protein 45 n=1 Tax=Jaminaea rosea TaxID=1569628 RepID=A0A316UVC7_9BASI|nr:hypothetical protein BDZ90DRAFT_278606 [Jaminaea rosea]PWN29229.1 hypothetical protein BDZ90DRAFT_278606 [Jaminaea rosea]